MPNNEEIRAQQLHELYKLVFLLVKYGRFSYSDLMNMYVSEIRMFYKLMVEDAEEQKKKIEEASRG